MLNSYKVIIVICCALGWAFPAEVISGEGVNFDRIVAEESLGAGTGFIGGMVAMGLWMAVAGGKNCRGMKVENYLNSYVIGSMVSSAFGVYYVGKYGGDNGEYLHALAGSFCGTLLGYAVGIGKERGFALYVFLLPFLQSAGGVAGFNFIEIRDAFINSDKKGVKLAVPRIHFSKMNEDDGYLVARMNLFKMSV